VKTGHSCAAVTHQTRPPSRTGGSTANRKFVSGEGGGEATPRDIDLGGVTYAESEHLVRKSHTYGANLFCAHHFAKSSSQK
jgi:hypothetical protein